MHGKTLCFYVNMEQPHQWKMDYIYYFIQLNQLKLIRSQDIKQYIEPGKLNTYQRQNTQLYRSSLLIPDT